MNRIFGAVSLGALALGLMLASGASSAASDIVLKANSYFPAQTKFTQQFLQFVKEVNADKALGVHIKFLGGPEVIPAPQQGLALKNDVVDMTYGPTNNYYSFTRAGEAPVASGVTAEQARKQGAFKLLNSIYESKMNVHFLASLGSGIQFFHIWTNTKPEFDAQGKIAGHLSLRSVQLYKGVLQGMGFAPVTVQVPDVYTALQRGVVKGVAWPTVGINDLGWLDYLKYQIDPGFYNNSTVVLVNLDAWNRIPKDKRAKLQALADRFEVKSTKEFRAIEKKTMKIFKAKGGKVIHLHGAALKNLEHLAATVPWQDMRNAGMPAAQVEALRKAFNPPK